MIKSGVNNYFPNPLFNRFKKINIKKKENEECRLPKLGDINISSYKDNISLIFDKIRTNSSKNKLHLVNLNKNDYTVEQYSNYSNSPIIYFYKKK